MLLAGATLVLVHTRNRNPSVYEFSQWLYLCPLAVAAYYGGLRSSMFLSLVITAFFMPFLIGQIAGVGITAPIVRLGLLLGFFNLFAVLCSLCAGLYHQRERLLAALETVHVTGDSTQVESMMTLISNQSVRVCRADGGEFYMTRPDGQALTCQTGKPPTIVSHRPAIPDDLTLLEWLIERNEPMLLSDLAHDSRLDVPSDIANQRTSLLAIPFRAEQKTAGILALWRNNAPPFGEDDRDLLNRIMGNHQAVLQAARSAQLTTQFLSAQTRSFSILLETSSFLSSARTQDELLGSVCQKMIESVESTSCKIYLFHKEDDALVLRAYRSIRKPESEAGIGLSVSLARVPWLGPVMLGGEPILLEPGVTGYETQGPGHHLTPDGNGGSTLLLPLCANEQGLGLAVLSEERGLQRSRFTPDKIALCKALTKLCALAIQNMRSVESILEERERFRLLVENLAEGIIRCDLKGRLVSFNPAAERITGVSAASAVGRRCSDLFQATDPDGVPLCENQCPLCAVQDSNRPPGPIEQKERLRLPDGRRIIISHTVAPFMDADGRAVGTASIIRDISRGEELARFKSDFASMVSHELRAPLSNINATAALLQEHLLAPEARQEMLKTVADESKRLGRMVHDILEAGRMERAGIQRALEPLALIPIIAKILADYRATSDNHPFEFDPPPEPLYVLGDPESLQVVLANLLENAVKYSPVGCAITVSAKRTADHIVTSIEDRGMGVSPDELDAIFRPFMRGLGRNPNVSGLGLGLYIARTLVMAQGGNIWVESEPGRGSRFCFTLPVLRGFDDDQDSRR